MRLSAKAEYAILAMLDLAAHPGHGLISIQAISERQGIPQRYLEQVLLLLKRAGFLLSRRGSSGGYSLIRSPQEITVGEVIRAVEGSISPFEQRPRGQRAQYVEHSQELHELWQTVAEAVGKVVDNITFADLVRQARERRSRARPMYHI